MNIQIFIKIFAKKIYLYYICGVQINLRKRLNYVVYRFIKINL